MTAPSQRRTLLPIFLIVLVDVFGLTLVIPLLAIYAERFSATPLQATLLVSTYAVCQLVSGPLLGQASDRTGFITHTRAYLPKSPLVRRAYHMGAFFPRRQAPSSVLCYFARRLRSTVLVPRADALAPIGAAS